MFKIIEEKQNDISRVKILNKTTGEYLSIVPEYGANVNELVLQKHNKLFSILDGNNCTDEFKTRRIFNSAKLFPFPNRVNEGKYNFSGKSYQLPINYEDEGNSVHGFVYDKKFEIYNTNVNSNEIVITGNNLIPKGTKEFSGYQKLSRIGEIEFDSCFILNSNINQHIVELYESKENNKISLWFEGGKGKYNYLQLYIPPDRNSIAIEPTTCNVDSYNNKAGLQILNPNEWYSAKYGVKLL